MTRLESLEAEVLGLAPTDRMRLVERALASLDTADEVEAAWDALAQARSAELDAGQVVAVDLTEAIARLEARFPG